MPTVDPLLERLAGAAVVEHGLAVFRQPGLLEGFLDGLFARPVEDRAMSAEAELGRGPTEMRLENLTHVHTAGDAQRIEHDVDRRAVLEERHVFDRQASWR